jgi:hypothetical protein
MGKKDKTLVSADSYSRIRVGDEEGRGKIK